MAKLSVSDVHVRYGTNPVLKGVSIELADGEIIALLGRSGSGKSTLLRAIAGLEQPTQGTITIGDKTVFDHGCVNVPPEARNLGLVFQSYALWPHRTVRDNVGYPLKVRKMAAPQLRAQVDEVLDSVGLAEYGDRHPSELSGGQQQRVALARALVYRPPLILLDEPLSNLDAKLRDEARVWIRQIIKKYGLTGVFVTHDQVEAMGIADRIALLDGGQMVQSGTPEELYTSPNSFFAADFMGLNDCFEVTIEAIGGEQATCRLGEARIVGRDKSGKRPGEKARAVIRVESLRVVDGPGPARVPATLVTSVYVGSRWEHLFDVAGQQLRAFTTSRLPDAAHHLELPNGQLWIF